MDTFDLVRGSHVLVTESLTAKGQVLSIHSLLFNT